MNWTPSTVILASIVAILVVGGMGLIPGKLDDQIVWLVETLIPWAPLFVFLYLGGAGIMQGIGRGIGAFFNALWSGIKNVFWTLAFVTFFFPLAMADTFVFGALAQRLWLYQSPVIIVLALTSFVFYLMGGVSKNFWRRYYGFMVLCWGAALLWSAIVPSLYRTETVVYRAKGDGTVYAVPTRSVYISRSEDEEKTNIEFTAFGRIGTVAGKYYAPFGDPEDRIPDPYGGWYIPRGQITFLVHKTRNTIPLAVATQPLEEGIVKLAGIDIGEQAGGYYFKGKVEVPAGVSGWIMPMFEGIMPSNGVVKVTFRISPEKSLPGQVLSIPWYKTSTILVVGTVGVLLAPLLIKSFMGLSAGLTTLLYVVLIIVYSLTMIALTQVEPTIRGGYLYLEQKLTDSADDRRRKSIIERNRRGGRVGMQVETTNPSTADFIRKQLNDGMKVIMHLETSLGPYRSVWFFNPTCNARFESSDKFGVLRWCDKDGKEIGSARLNDSTWIGVWPKPEDLGIYNAAGFQLETAQPYTITITCK
jgi:hypothetical protein